MMMKPSFACPIDSKLRANARDQLPLWLASECNAATCSLMQLSVHCALEFATHVRASKANIAYIVLRLQLEAYSDKGWLVDMVDQLAAIVNAESSSPLQFTPTGTWFISDPLADALENALVLGDAISIPTALAVLAITLQSARYATRCHFCAHWCTCVFTVGIAACS